MQTNTVIVGASAAGLATAACLKRVDIPHLLLEQHHQVATAWRSHYERLHLHTDKGSSALPYLAFPKHYPRYPSRRQVVAYLEQYAHAFDVRPRFGQKVVAIRRRNGGWETHSQDTIYHASNVVIATGYNRVPHVPSWPGQAQFRGTICHSSQYKNGRPYAGQDVLVVGFGNSACEIALDLHEHSAHPDLAVRSPVNILPRDLFGIPVVTIGILMAKLPTWLADALNAPIIRLVTGDFTRYGLTKLPYGPFTQIQRDRRIPLLDIGTLDLIKRGRIQVYPGIQQFTTDGVVFTNGVQKEFDTVILATGYRPQLADFLAEAEQVTDEQGAPRCSGVETAFPGLYFCGFRVSPAGMLREIGIEAKRIARSIRQKQ